MTQEDREVAVILDCLLRFMSLASMYPSGSLVEAQRHIKSMVGNPQNYPYEDTFLTAAINLIEAENRE